MGSQRVVIGMDPHKRSVTIEVMAGDETVLGGGRFTTDPAGFEALGEYVRTWPERTWAIEGCNGIGRHVALRLMGQGQEVVDVPPKLSARARVFATGQGRKTDATDAHSIALVGTRMAGLRPVVDDEQLAVLRTLVDRRRSLGEEHTRMVSQLHHLLLELVPGGAKRFLSAAQAKQILAGVRPRDAAGKVRRRVAAELVGDLERTYKRKKAADKELRGLVQVTGTGLLDLNGIGPSGAARLLVEVGDITGSPTGLTSPPGPAPPRSTRPPGTTSATGSPAQETARSTGCCTSWPPSSCATPASAATTTTARRRPARRPWKPCAASRGDSPTSCSAPCSTTPSQHRGRAREDTGERHFNPARPAHIPTPTLRISHFPDPPRPSLEPASPPRLDTEGSHDRASRPARRTPMGAGTPLGPRGPS